ncbi:MAG: hypothetical protein K0Q62_584 [Phenylobacterium sp.]|jgi:uncharacterized protein (TIGR00369 family)|nr:hypothetical protein [Phenylobacterium sp.]
MTPELKLDAARVQALLLSAFPGTPENLFPKVIEVEPGRVHLVLPYREGMLRPGNLVSGPTLMGHADTAAYALVLCHVGEQLMAVTSSLVMNFLRGAKPGDVHAEARLLRLGRRNAVCDVRLWTESPDRLAAQATVTYAIP